MKKICIIAQFPPPMHGLSKAVETLYNSELSKEFEFEKIDITNNIKILNNITMIKRSSADLFYFTISQTRGGNLRDLVILRAIGNRSCVVHLHGGYYRKMIEKFPNWQREVNKKAIGRLSGAIVLGKSFQYVFEGMLPKEKIHIVPNCVDNEYLMSDKEFEEKIITISQRTITHVLYLSNLIRSKGYPEVLEIAKYEKDHVEVTGERRFHFDFAGKFFDKKEELFFYKYIKDNELSEYVTYHGIVNDDKKRNLLKYCDIFILLTYYPKEGQPISILEAMGNGMMIVTTNHSGISDVVTDKINGFLFDKVEPLAIYKKLILVDIEKILYYQKNNRLEIKRYYTQTSYIRNLGNVMSG
jgi:glycosyltransferase involved in cell wall biosynthesis